MSRLSINYSWLFQSLSGQQQASKLDDDFSDVQAGNVTIGGRVLAASYTMVADDIFSFFVCVPTNDMNLTPPSSLNANDSFWVSNQSTTKNVTLIASMTIDGVPTLNPVLPGNYGSLTNVIGGFAIYDGSTWNLYPKLFML